jgi:hypothetical protein
MDDISLLRKLDRVAAPPGFEDRVLGELARRRTARIAEVRTRPFRYTLAGAAAALLAGFLVVNTFVLRRGDGSRELAGVRDSLPITETMNYRSEARNAALEPRTVYILEQVSDASNRNIKY